MAELYRVNMYHGGVALVGTTSTPGYSHTGHPVLIYAFSDEVTPEDVEHVNILLRALSVPEWDGKHQTMDFIEAVEKTKATMAEKPSYTAVDAAFHHTGHSRMAKKVAAEINREMETAMRVLGR